MSRLSAWVTCRCLSNYYELRRIWNKGVAALYEKYVTLMFPAAQIRATDVQSTQ
jgi:hypothetical protein